MASRVDLEAVVSAKDNASSVIKGVAGNTQTSMINMAKAVALGQAAWDALKWAVRTAAGAFEDTLKAAQESEFANVRMTQALRNSGTVTEEQILFLLNLQLSL